MFRGWQLVSLLLVRPSGIAALQMDLHANGGTLQPDLNNSGGMEYPQTEVEAFLDRVVTNFKISADDRSRAALIEEANGQKLNIGIAAGGDCGYAADALQNWKDYAALHKYQLSIFNGSLTEACGERLGARLANLSGAGNPNIWSKVCHLRNLLRADDGASHVLVVDADTFVQKPEFSALDLARQKLGGKSVGFFFDDRATHGAKCLNHNMGFYRQDLCYPNTFFSLWYKSPAAFMFVDGWLDDAINRCANWTSQHPVTQNVLWHCSLLAPGQADLIRVEDGADRTFSVYLRNREVPLIHFLRNKRNRNMRPVNERLAEIRAKALRDA